MVIIRAQDTNSIDANYAAVMICMRTTTSDLHAVTAYRHGERQEVHHQGGHANQLAFNGQTVNCSPCSVAPMPVAAHQRISNACEIDLHIQLVRSAARSHFVVACMRG